MHCTSMLWIGIAALLFTVVEYLACCRESMAQKQVDVRMADFLKTSESSALNTSAPKRKLTQEKAKELATKTRWVFWFLYVALRSIDEHRYN